MSMIRINNIKLSIEESIGENENTILRRKVEKSLKVPFSQVREMEISKKSVDARNKNDIKIIYSVDVSVKNEQKFLKCKDVSQTKKFEFIVKKVEDSDKKKVVIVGCGPAGLFAGLVLAEMGYKPIILERGKDVDSRKKDVKQFWDTGKLNCDSNVQFGEGGAGTFSDGKLTSGIKDKLKHKVLNELIEAGADCEIKISSKPHIGTDKLIEIVKNIRKKIISLGGEVRFLNKMTEMNCKDGKIESIVVENQGESYEMEVEALILAIGHSARDTVSMLFENRLVIEPKAFSVGVRIEHSQKMINESQYGKADYAKLIGAADYKLNVHLGNGRGVYTFCMCPGGHVVCGATEEDGLVTNGMSYHSRDNENANSALLVSVTPKDYMIDEKDPLAGIEFQRKLERRAFTLGGGKFSAPAQLVGDFLNDRKTVGFGAVAPTYKPNCVGSDLRECLDPFIVESLKEGIVLLNSKMEGFSSFDAVMTAVETRSSSAVILKRDPQTHMSNIDGVFPCGEGAGYAGGIISACVDGIRTALFISNS